MLYLDIKYHNVIWNTLGFKNWEMCKDALNSLKRIRSVHDKEHTSENLTQKLKQKIKAE